MATLSIVLQRLRFSNLEFHATPPNSQFKPSVWEKSGRFAYWKPLSDGVSQKKETIELTLNSSVSSDTFFNAFYIAHWRKLTSLPSLGLNLQFTGRFVLEICGHTKLGETETLEKLEIGTQGETEIAYTFPLEKLPHAIRFSFKVTSREEGAQLIGGSWRTPTSPTHPVRLAIGITTFNRPEFIQRLINRILKDPGLQNETIRIYVIDQSDASHLDHLNGARCRIVRQKNFGSSGGFTRAIHESLYAKEDFKPTHILLMDDDVEAETDSILRAIRMTQFAKAPFILGGTQLDIFQPTYAYSVGEIFQKDAYGYYDIFRALKNNLLQIDASLPNYMNAISIPHSTDYCGWWFCMIPVEAILKMGLPLQFFVKGDDVEYGLRAKTHGYSSLTVAGIGVWHPPPSTKSAPWLRYMDFYSHLMLNTFDEPLEVQNLFQMQAIWALEAITKHKYQSAAAMIRGMEDFLGGWDFYQKRTFPDHILEVRKEVASYHANEKGIPEIKLDQSTALKDRLIALVARFKSEGEAAQSSLKTNLPQTTSRSAWESYFLHGNHSKLDTKK
jgi:galactofuranosylgalactofuranosylrhamnosyl-N-acetylglucosaminyl-diphospho-decaprenol beta-1,5/1,6-galactofuranosyltransferase